MSLGCSVGPDFEKPMVFNNEAILENIASTGENAKKINPYWYKYFGDEQLNNLVLLALKNARYTLCLCLTTVQRHWQRI